eukprot:1837058-Rhodomonas_salina.2
MREVRESRTARMDRGELTIGDNRGPWTQRSRSTITTSTSGTTYVSAAATSESRWVPAWRSTATSGTATTCTRTEPRMSAKRTYLKKP